MSLKKAAAELTSELTRNFNFDIGNVSSDVLKSYLHFKWTDLILFYATLVLVVIIAAFLLYVLIKSNGRDFYNNTLNDTISEAKETVKSDLNKLAQERIKLEKERRFLDVKRQEIIRAEMELEKRKKL